MTRSLDSYGLIAYRQIASDLTEYDLYNGYWFYGTKGKTCFITTDPQGEGANDLDHDALSPP